MFSKILRSKIVLTALLAVAMTGIHADGSLVLNPAWRAWHPAR